MSAYEDGLVDEVLRVIEREVRPLGLIARIEITRAVEAAMEAACDGDGRRGDWDDDDDNDPEPEPDLPPQAGPSAPRVDLEVLLELKSIALEPA